MSDTEPETTEAKPEKPEKPEKPKRRGAGVYTALLVTTTVVLVVGTLFLIAQYRKYNGEFLDFPPFNIF